MQEVHFERFVFSRPNPSQIFYSHLTKTALSAPMYSLALDSSMSTGSASVMAAIAAKARARRDLIL
jgi:hypothetical protein